MDERDLWDGFEWRRGLGVCALVALVAIAILLTLRLIQEIPSGYDQYEEAPELPPVTNATPVEEFAIPPVPYVPVLYGTPQDHYWTCAELSLYSMLEATFYPSLRRTTFGCGEETEYGGIRPQ